eukprot:scaffold2858_cov659-Pavlova_lutheri.AAC.129
MLRSMCRPFVHKFGDGAPDPLHLLRCQRIRRHHCSFHFPTRRHEELVERFGHFFRVCQSAVFRHDHEQVLREVGHLELLHQFCDPFAFLRPQHCRIAQVVLEGGALVHHAGNLRPSISATLGRSAHVPRHSRTVRCSERRSFPRHAPSSVPSPRGPASSPWRRSRTAPKRTVQARHKASTAAAFHRHATFEGVQEVSRRTRSHLARSSEVQASFSRTWTSPAASAAALVAKLWTKHVVSNALRNPNRARSTTFRRSSCARVGPSRSKGIAGTLPSSFELLCAPPKRRVCSPNAAQCDATSREKCVQWPTSDARMDLGAVAPWDSRHTATNGKGTRGCISVRRVHLKRSSCTPSGSVAPRTIPGSRGVTGNLGCGKATTSSVTDPGSSSTHARGGENSTFTGSTRHSKA